MCSSSPERSFMCRMHTSKSFRLQHGSCSLLVRGRYHPLPPCSQPGSPDQRVFTALCTPTADHQGSSAASRSHNCFTSSHRPDMTFTQLSDRYRPRLYHTAFHLCWDWLVWTGGRATGSLCHVFLLLGPQCAVPLGLLCRGDDWSVLVQLPPPRRPLLGRQLPQESK